MCVLYVCFYSFNLCMCVFCYHLCGEIKYIYIYKIPISVTDENICVKFHRQIEYMGHSRKNRSNWVVNGSLT